LNNSVSAPTDEEVIEYHDSEEEIQRKAVEFAHILRNAKHFVVYTGAGIRLTLSFRYLKANVIL